MKPESGPPAEQGLNSTPGTDDATARNKPPNSAPPLHDADLDGMSLPDGSLPMADISEGRLPVPTFHCQPAPLPSDGRRLSLRPVSEAALIPPGNRNPPNHVPPARLAQLVKLATEKGCVLEWLDDEDSGPLPLEDSSSDSDSDPGLIDSSDDEDWRPTRAPGARRVLTSNAHASQMNALMEHKDLLFPASSRPEEKVWSHATRLRSGTSPSPSGVKASGPDPPATTSSSSTTGPPGNLGSQHDCHYLRPLVTTTFRCPRD